MHAEDSTPERFVGAEVAATRLGVPIAWLKGEAVANRIPHLKAGRRLLFSVSAVRDTLVERASNVVGACQEVATHG